MLKKIKDNRFSIYFLSIIIVQIGVIIFFGSKKGGLALDEIWTFNLSNSYYFPFLGDASKYFNVMLEKNFFADHLHVKEGVEFSYDSVFYNQSKDVHPPLYYILIHTLCSIVKSDNFKWLGVGLNIPFFIGIQYFILKIVNFISEDKKISLWVCAFYGFSLGAVSTVLYIRMYALLTLLSVIALYLNIQLMKKIINKLDFEKKDFFVFFGIFFTYLLGFLTQYYFLIFGFFLSLFVGVFVIFHAGIKKASIYALATILPILVGVGIFPASIEHTIGGGYRGAEAINNIKNKSFLIEIGEFLKLLNIDTYFIYFAISIFILAVIYSFKNNGIKSFFNVSCFKRIFGGSLSFGFISYFIVFFVLLFSFLVISKIAAFREPRYIYYLYPLVFILIVPSFYYFASNFIKIRGLLWVFLFSIILFCSFLSLDASKMKHMFLKEQSVINNLKNKFHVKTIIAVTEKKKWWPVTSSIRFLKEFEYSYLTMPSDIYLLDYDFDDSIAVLIDRRLKNHEEILGSFKFYKSIQLIKEVERNKYQYYLYKLYLLQK